MRADGFRRAIEAVFCPEYVRRENTRGINYCSDATDVGKSESRYSPDLTAGPSWCHIGSGTKNCSTRRDTMKKILLAAVAVIASATIANAQAVTISGEGRMGIQGMDTGAWSWRQESRLTLDFNVAVEADHGLTFGAWTRARMETGGLGALSANGYGVGIFSSARVWVEANNFRLTFGNTDGALATAGTSHGWLGGCGIGYEGGQICGDSVGLDTIAQQEDATYSILANHVTSRAMITYTMGDTVVAISHDRDISTEIGARTSFGAFTVAAGYTDIGTGVWTVSGHYDAGVWGGGLIVAGGMGATNWALSGSANLGGGSLYGYYGDVFGASAYGLSYGYDLGGGATATFGAERVNYLGLTTASVGIAFSF